jgi:hypothetical protein
MERLRKCLSGPARDCVKMILLTNDAENAIVMLKRNYGRSEKIVEQLLEEAKAQKPVTDSNDFQEFSNLVENLSVTVENDGDMSQFTNKIVIREFFKKLPESIMDGKTSQTKREVLRVTMSLFDPLGFLSPVTIASRIQYLMVKRRRYEIYSKELAGSTQILPPEHQINPSIDNFSKKKV